MKKLLPVFLAVGAFASLNAQISTWIGTNSSDWADGGNWSAGVPGSTETGILSGAVTSNLPNVGASATLRYLNIESGGWTINSTGGTGNLRFTSASNRDALNELNVTGAGLTVINANVVGATNYNAPNMYVGAGSKLVINGDIINPTGRSWSMRGDGYYVVNGAVPNDKDFTPEPDTVSGLFGSYIFNGTSGGPQLGNHNALTISSGNVFGGTTPVIQMYQYTALTIESGARLVIGGDGATIPVDGYDGGEAVSTMTFDSSNTNRAGVVLQGGATLEMDLVSPGASDQIIIGTYLTDDFALNGATLALYGDNPAFGIYTLLQTTDPASIYTGTFGSVLFNGAAIPGDWTLDYNPDSITLTVPEPSTYAILLGLAALGLVAYRRRR